MKKDRSEVNYKPGRNGIEKYFGELEGSVMEAIWSRAHGTVREIHEDLYDAGDNLAYTTVMTVMSRLHEKGHLRRKSEGIAYRYRPTASREEFLAQISREVFSGLAEDLSGPVLSAFVDGLSASELKRLEEISSLIRDKRDKRDKRGKQKKGRRR